MKAGARGLELKICERCGGLWLRPAASEWRYCRGCVESLREYPEPERQRESEVAR